MIANERQYKISRQQLERLREALSLVKASATSEVGSEAIVEAEMNALSSQIHSIAEEIDEYAALKSGKVHVSADTNLAELPHVLIRARIARGLTQRDLAERVGLKEQQIQRYESQQYASASLRRLRQMAQALELSVTDARGEAGPVRPGLEPSETIEWSRFPVKEMYRRGWFEGFQGSLADAVQGAEEIVRDFVGRSLGVPAVTFRRQKVRAGDDYDRYALLAWECRVLSLASQRGVARYRASTMNASWFRALLRMSGESDGPIRARDHLADAGICLVIEPHLSGTYLDGAALLQRSRPVIGMTLRYDRLDHFWFVLMHELVHVKRHLRHGTTEEVFDDLESEVAGDTEREADAGTAEILIPSEVWKRSVARYTRSRASVVALARELQISPAIVAGRIRHEAGNYVILNDLVGQGEVRRQFPEATYGE